MHVPLCNMYIGKKFAKLCKEGYQNGGLGPLEKCQKHFFRFISKPDVIFFRETDRQHHKLKNLLFLKDVLLLDTLPSADVRKSIEVDTTEWAGDVFICSNSGII